MEEKDGLSKASLCALAFQPGQPVSEYGPIPENSTGDFGRCTDTAQCGGGDVPAALGLKSTEMA